MFSKLYDVGFNFGPIKYVRLPSSLCIVILSYFVVDKR